MNINNSSIPARILIYSTLAVILTIGMRELAPLLTTILFSLFAALIFTPLIRWLKGKGIPGELSILLAILLFVLIVTIIGTVAVKAAIDFGNQIPMSQMKLMEFVDNLTRYVPSKYLATEGDFSLNSILRGSASVVISLMRSAIDGLVNTGTTAGIIVLTTAFLLIDVANIPEKVNSELEDQSELQRRMSKFGNSLVSFVVIKAETNLIVAVGITIFFLIGRIDFAILWGVLIFLLSYIPYIGLFIAVIPPIMLALFKYGPLGALAVIVIVTVVDAIAENVIFPALAGKGLKLSPAFLFLALIYWSYVLGTAGVLLSVPLTIILKIILESFEETKWMASLMGPTDNIEALEKSEEHAE